MATHKKREQQLKEINIVEFRNRLTEIERQVGALYSKD